MDELPANDAISLLIAAPPAPTVTVHVPAARY
jgi:hypothetical protein